MCVKLFLGSQVVGLVLYMRGWCHSVTLLTASFGDVFERAICSDTISIIVSSFQSLRDIRAFWIGPKTDYLTCFSVFYYIFIKVGVFLEVFSDKILHKSNFKAPLLQLSAFRWKSLVIAFCITSHDIFGAFHHECWF